MKVSLTFRSVPKSLGHFGTGAKMSHRQFGSGADVPLRHFEYESRVWIGAIVLYNSVT